MLQQVFLFLLSKQGLTFHVNHFHIKMSSSIFSQKKNIIIVLSAYFRITTQVVKNAILVCFINEMLETHQK